MKRILTMTLLITLLALSLSACQLYTHDYREDVLEYAMIAESGDLSVLDEYPNLEYVDLRGSTCYDEILAYSETHPDVTVRYNVQLGERRFNEDTAEVSLNCYEIEYDILLQNLKYLPALQSVHLNQVTFTKEQLDTLVQTYPDISFTYTVEACGRRYDHSATELDLGHMTVSDMGDVVNAISLLPNLTNVNLVSATGDSQLTIADVRSLFEACPGISFNYEFALFGQTVSTLAQELVFDSVEIGNEGVGKIREALGIMKHCTYVKLDSCEIDNEVLAQLRSDYPDIKVVWRVFAGKFSILTDEQMLRMPYSLTDEDAASLKYCNDIKYLDVVNSKITNIDFVAHMPNLECAIFTLTKIKDLSPLTNCPNLIWLELSSCTGIKELSGLSGMTNLKYLNISATKVKDLSALDGLPLERFNCVKSSVGTAALEAFEVKHPNCRVTSKGSALGYGWRYDDKNQTEPFSYYAHMREVFRYDDKNFTGNRKES